MSDVASQLDAALKALEIAAVVGSAAAVLFKVGRMTERFEFIGRQQAAEISEIKKSVGSLIALNTSVAVTTSRQDQQAERMNGMDRRFDTIERTLDGFRRGEGIIRPGT